MSSALEKLSEALMFGSTAAAEPVTTGVQSLTGAEAKNQDLARDIVDCTMPNKKMTSDYGAGMSNTDAWLKVVNPEDLDGHGPSLLEDQFAREKARMFLDSIYLWIRMLMGVNGEDSSI